MDKTEIITVTVLLMLIIAVVVSLPIWLTTGSVSLSKTGLTGIGQLLGVLFVVSLFLERALDVFLTTWRALDGEKLDKQIRATEQKISEIKALAEDLREAKKGELDGLNEALEKYSQQRLKRSARTRTIALWSSLFFGLLVSAIGIRTFQTLVEPDSLDKLPDFQRGLFHILDVVLTGGLIAGGSDGVHKIVEVYRGFMEASAERAKRAKKDAA